MGRFGILTAVLLAVAAPAAGQIVRPIITPPCVSKYCPGKSQTRPQASMPSHACPPGTVYMPQKGTCKVLPRGN